jgi:hypothetical protein
MSALGRVGDLISQIALFTSTAPIDIQADTAGTEIDLQGYEGCIFVACAGVLTGGGFDFKIEHSDTSGSGFAEVPDGQLLPSGTGQEAARGWEATDDGECRKIGYIGSKRYLKCTLIETGTVTVGLVCVIAVLFGSRIRPAPVDTVA